MALKIQTLERAISRIEHDAADFRTHYEVLKYLKTLTHDLGMTAFLVLSLPSVDTIEIGAAKILTNWPPEMIEHYDRHNLLVDSPVIRRLLQSTCPFTYDVASINSTRNAGKRSAVVEPFDRYEMGKGAYFPVHDAAGGRGAISFSGQRLFNLEEMTKLLFITTFVYDRLSQLALAEKHLSAKLSEMEIDCLRLVAGGKPGGEIAKMLATSETAVNNYITSATKKLGCNNRTHAVVTALRLNLIRAF